MKLKFVASVKDLVIFLVYAVVLFYFVALIVANLYSFSHFVTFTGLNPAYAFIGENFTATIVFYILALIVTVFALGPKFYSREEGFGFSKPKKEEDGYSRWATEKEMQKAYDIKKVVLNEKNYEAGGVPIMNNGKVAYVDDGENHTLIIGASGSGKTQGIIHPIVKLLAKHDESIIVSDPKGEVYKESVELLKSRGYKIVLLNFREPQNGQAWNPFSLPYRMYKEGKIDKATELLEDLGLNILYDDKSQADPFWEKSSADYFGALSLGLFEDAKEEEVNINSINMMSTVGEERFNTSNYIKEYFTMKGELSSSYVMAASVINAPAETKGGVLAIFKQKIRVFSSRADLSEMLSRSDFDMRDIGREKTAVFLVIHDEKTTYHPLMTTFIKQCYECLIDVAQENGGKLKNRTNFLLDEFANMPPLKDVESMVTAARSRNIRFSFVIQNFSQLNKVYGADIAETIKGNCGNIIYLITTELKALEEISKLCGEVKPKKAKEGEVQESPKPLVSVADLQRMEKFQYLVKRFRCNPFKTKMTPNFKIDWGTDKFPLGEYPTREHREVEIFDLKEFVKQKTKEKVQQAMANGEFKPMMGGSASSFGTSSNSFASSASPFTSSTKPSIAAALGGKPDNDSNESGGIGGALNVEDLIKKIDARIAEMEAEEAEADKNNAGSIQTKPIINIGDDKLTSNVEKPIINQVVEDTNNEEGFNPFGGVTFDEEAATKASEGEVKDPFKDMVKPDLMAKPEVTEKPDLLAKDSSTEKPKINVDVDSIIVNQNVTDDEFFDDFFGDEK